MSGIRDEWTTEDGSVRLLLGDCLEILPGLGQRSNGGDGPAVMGWAENKPSMPNRWAENLVLNVVFRGVFDDSPEYIETGRSKERREVHRDC